MNVKELKEMIGGYPDDTLVVIAPSHSFSPLSGGEILNYVAENSWSGEVYEDADMIALEETDDSLESDDAIILYPTN